VMIRKAYHMRRSPPEDRSNHAGHLTLTGNLKTPTIGG
jgi:hypothetical protein